MRILGVAAAVGVSGIALAAWILRFEFRHQLRERRYGGYVQIGGQR